MPFDHQVQEDARGAAGNAMGTVDQDVAVVQGLVHKIHNGVFLTGKFAHASGVVKDGNALVGEITIVFLKIVGHAHFGRGSFGGRHIEDVGNPSLLQLFQALGVFFAAQVKRVA